MKIAWFIMNIQQKLNIMILYKNSLNLPSLKSPLTNKQKHSIVFKQKFSKYLQTEKMQDKQLSTQELIILFKNGYQPNEKSESFIKKNYKSNQSKIHQQNQDNILSKENINIKSNHFERICNFNAVKSKNIGQLTKQQLKQINLIISKENPQEKKYHSKQLRKNLNLILLKKFKCKQIELEQKKKISNKNQSNSIKKKFIDGKGNDQILFKNSVRRWYTKKSDAQDSQKDGQYRSYLQKTCLFNESHQYQKIRKSYDKKYRQSFIQESNKEQQKKMIKTSMHNYFKNYDNLSKCSRLKFTKPKQKSIENQIISAWNIDKEF